MICVCGHTANQHDGGEGRCRARVNPWGDQWEDCPCVAYEEGDEDE